MVSQTIVWAITTIIVILIYIWLFTKIFKQYKRLKDPVYLKKVIENKEWGGKPITEELIKKMTFLTLTAGIILNIIAFYLLFSIKTQFWAGVFALGIIMLYGAYAWMKYNKRKAIKETDTKFTSIYTRALTILLVVFVIIALIFKDYFMSSPIFEIWIIAIALGIILSSEYHEYRIRE